MIRTLSTRSASDGELTDGSRSAEVTRCVGRNPGDIQADGAIEGQAYDEYAAEADLGGLCDGEDEVSYSSKCHVHDDETRSVLEMDDQLSAARTGVAKRSYLVLVRVVSADEIRNSSDKVNRHREELGVHGVLGEVQALDDDGHERGKALCEEKVQVTVAVKVKRRR